MNETENKIRGINQKERGFYKSIVKPVMDRLLALFALIVLLPIFLMVAIAIKLDTRGPVFFRQNRLGRYGKIFRIYKFRSMIVHEPRKNGDNKLYENDPRITRVGSFIRKTSLDELPQLINIVKGDMSFIGPRPPVTYFPKPIEQYSDFEYQRFYVKPGISGLAVVRFREEHDWDVNIPVDVEYVQNYSFLYDVRLFFVSFTYFFKTNNIYRKE